jgi:hypothetical protein
VNPSENLLTDKVVSAVGQFETNATVVAVRIVARPLRGRKDL